jgi:hypothetical protein
MEIEPHIKATIDAIPEQDLRPLLCSMLQRLRATDGMEYLCSQYPIIGQHWVEPLRWQQQ